MSDENGHTAFCYSNDDEGNGEVDVLLFWSDKAYAGRARDSEFQEYDVSSMTLFDFLYRWLPGMSKDGLLAGTNWTGDLVGLEFDPYNLRIEIEGKLPDEQNDKYQAKYRELTS